MAVSFVPSSTNDPAFPVPREVVTSALLHALVDGVEVGVGGGFESAAIGEPHSSCDGG